MESVLPGKALWIPKKGSASQAQLYTEVVDPKMLPLTFKQFFFQIHTQEAHLVLLSHH